MSGSGFSLPSFAKINWTLRVLGKRPDGYHEVVTVLQTVSLHDELHFKPRGDSQVIVSCRHPDVPVGETNLISRAAQLIQRNHNLNLGADITLRKTIPPGGGLGGGSSNAAVALLGLATLWKLNLDFPTLLSMSKSLGADVPFFLVGGTVMATGTGNELRALPDARYSHLLIITPQARISTAAAYGALKVGALTSPGTDPILFSSRFEPSFSDSNQWQVENDFEAVIFEMEPEIKRVKEALFQSGARDVLLAGSGSSVFGIFDSAEDQRGALEEIRSEAGWQIFSCTTLSRGEYVRAMAACGTPLLRSSLI